ncbi:type IV secretion system protein VirB1 [Luteibacter sp. OK325]|nr:type IV secretion system protein VirB1 [Luteibacter sp. OK325]
MMSCPNLAVPAEVMQHVVNVESSRNPYAIGVVGGQLVRQPQNLPEAVATVHMLEDKGYNYSLGIAQINRTNFGRYGLDTFEKAFEYCPNMVAGSRILAQCYASAGKDWGKAFSCYYSGNFTTGYQHGYVQRVFDSMTRSGSTAAVRAIPLMARAPVRIISVGKGVTSVTADSPAYRVAMRSILDATVGAAVTPIVAAATGGGGAYSQTAFATQDSQPPNPYAQGALPGAVPGTNPALVNTPQPLPGPIPTDPATAALMRQIGAQLPQNVPQPSGRIRTDPGTAAVMSQIGVSASSPGGNEPLPQPTGTNDVFVPQVRGPNDPVQGVAPQATPAPQRPVTDNADLRNGGTDGAFVF